jgi:hypothetical protein
VTHVVFTLTNWGELALDPALAPHEYCFARAHLARQIERRDVHLVRRGKQGKGANCQCTLGRQQKGNPPPPRAAALAVVLVCGVSSLFVVSFFPLVSFFLTRNLA